MLFSVKPAVCCYVYLNSQGQITSARAQLGEIGPFVCRSCVQGHIWSPNRTQSTNGQINWYLMEFCVRVCVPIVLQKLVRMDFKVQVLGIKLFSSIFWNQITFLLIFSFDSSFFGEMFTTEDIWFRYQEIQTYDFKHGLDIREYRHTILMFLLVCSGKLSEKSTKLQHL